MERLRVGIIGLGIGEQHLAGYRRHTGCEVVALCDLDAGKLAAARAQHPGMRLTRDADEVLLDQSINVVSIASFDDAHFSQAVRALERGKHVFVEKPLCRTLEELRAIKQLWAGHGGRVKLASNLVLRAAPLYQWLKQKVAAGDFGQVYAFDGDYLYGRLHKLVQGWRKDVEDYSVMAGGGIHLIDLFTWITAQRPAAVWATGNRLCTRGTAFRYEDYVAASLECPSGLVGRICANFGCVHPHQHVVRLFGTEATFLYDDAGARLHTARDPAIGAAPVSLAPLPAAKGELIPAFVGAILADEDLTADTQSFFDGISIGIACDRARRGRAPQEVQYV